MIYKPQYFCDFCGDEIKSNRAYRYKGKLFCTKHCIFKTLDIQFVKLEG